MQTDASVKDNAQFKTVTRPRDMSSCSPQPSDAYERWGKTFEMALWAFSLEFLIIRGAFQSQSYGVLGMMERLISATHGGGRAVGFKMEFDMNNELLYTHDTILENRTVQVPCEESEDIMPINRKKIRREIVLNGVKVWITADTEQEYVDKLLRLAGGIQQPTVTGSHIFKEYASRWFEVFSKPNVSNVTAITYQRQLDLHINPVIGNKTIETITVADIQDIFNRMGDSAKRETKNKVKIVLNQIFKMAVEDGLMVRNLLQSSSLRIKGLSASTTEPYTVDQMRYLASHLDSVKNPTDRAWLALSISLPLRPEEVLGLLWEDVDDENGVLHIRNTVTHPNRNLPEFKPYTKTEASIRDLVIPVEVLSYLPERGRPNEFVLGGERAISYTQLRGMTKRINVQTRFGETIVPRRFRTTVATDISAITHDLKLVQQMLGHSTPQMTLKHYVKGRSKSVDATAAIEQCYGLKAT